MRILLRTSITWILILMMSLGHHSPALDESYSLRINEGNVPDAFSKSEENLKDKLIFSRILPPKVKTIVLDAGHGGKDRGCKGHNETKEKHIALDITLKLGSYIESYFPDVKVIYTRIEDRFVTLNRRARIANENKADLFISIHCNYIRKRPDVMGSETYVMGLHTADHNLNVAMRENASISLEQNFQEGYDGYDPNSPESHIMLSMFQNAYLERSILFAELVEQQIPKSSNGKHSSRGVRQAGFLVLKATAMPSVLVETGYLSHEKDEAFLRTTEGKKDVAFAIFKAFSIYKNVIEGSDPGEVVTVAHEAKEEPIKDSSDKIIEQPVAPKPTPIKKEETVEETKPEPEQPVVEKKIDPISNDAKRPAPEVSKEAPEKVYMIQLVATPVPIDLLSSKYKHLADDIEVKKVDGLLKYLIPVGSEKSKALLTLKEIKASGFSNAFLSLYKGEERVQIIYE